MAKLVDFNQKEENINSRPSNQNFQEVMGVNLTEEEIFQELRC